jgi:hypothetical protein
MKEYEAEAAGNANPKLGVKLMWAPIQVRKLVWSHLLSWCVIFMVSLGLIPKFDKTGV